MRILVDADMLLFRATAATEVEVELDDDVWTRHSELHEARDMYWGYVLAWVEQFNVTPDDVWHCFTDRSAFRRQIFPGYKANRKGKPKPIGFKALKSELLREDTAFMFEQIEADDLISIFATMAETMDDPVIIASGDKDLMQIAGTHVWLDQVVTEQSDEAALRFTYQQCLAGDATDGVPGCPGIGAVTAERIVADFDLARPVDCWEEIVRTYEKKGKVVEPSKVATQQARLMRLLRTGEYNFDSHTVNLWNPPTR